MISRMKCSLTLIAAAVGVATLSMSAQTRKAAAPVAHKSFSVVEATIPEMRAALEQGRVTSRELVRQYLERIGTYEDRLHAAITVNPKALEEADARDRERAQGQARGPLHGTPLALTDNIQMFHMLPPAAAAA